MGRPLIAFSVAFFAVFALRAAVAGDPKPPAGTKPADKPSDKVGEPVSSEPDYKGPEIHWVHSLTDAIEEAAQRNVLLYIHSHGST